MIAAPLPASLPCNVPATPLAARPAAVPALPTLHRRHHQRLRDVYRSSGWPCRDLLEVDLLASGLLERRLDAEGRETLRVTDAGILQLAQAHAGNKAARSAHETLVERVCVEMVRAGRLVWRGLSLRTQVSWSDASADGPTADGSTADGSTALQVAADIPGLTGPDPAPEPAHSGNSSGVWAMACPDVFSIRHTSVEAYLEPIVHEIKVSRADLLGDLKKPNKRAAYLGLGGECWYVLGQGAKGKPIAQPDEIPPECGVMLWEGERLVVARPAPRKPMAHLPFHIWMALAQAAPVARGADGGQAVF